MVFQRLDAGQGPMFSIVGLSGLGWLGRLGRDSRDRAHAKIKVSKEPRLGNRVRQRGLGRLPSSSRSSLFGRRAVGRIGSLMLKCVTVVRFGTQKFASLFGRCLFSTLSSLFGWSPSLFGRSPEPIRPVPPSLFGRSSKKRTRAYSAGQESWICMKMQGF